MSRTSCYINGCNRFVNTDGLCSKHLNRVKKFGNPLIRTIYDENEIQIYGDIVTMYIYNKEGTKILETQFNRRHVDEVLRHKWCVKDKDKTPYVVTSIEGKLVRLHRFIINADENEVVDHIDGNPLNNLDDNLRIVNRKQNSYNCGLSKNNTSGHSGVSWMNKMKKYRAYIMIDRKQIHLGSFENIEDAIDARKKAEIKYFNEFSRLYGNETDESEE